MDAKISTLVHVRFADVDLMGHVNNAKFFTYFEQGRLAYFKNFTELDFTKFAVDGVSIILAEIKCTFRSPAYLDEMLRVKIRVREIGRSSFVMEYEVAEETSGRLVATGESVQVYFDYAKSREPGDSTRPKEEIRGD